MVVFSVLHTASSDRFSKSSVISVEQHFMFSSLHCAYSGNIFCRIYIYNLFVIFIMLKKILVILSTYCIVSLIREMYKCI